MKRDRVLAAVLLFAPAAIVFWVAAMSTLNHFQEGPYLQDSGWHSAIVYRNGVLPRNPAIAGSVPKEVTSFYGVHFAPIVTVSSLASYLFPIDRIDWFCLFLGAIFAPLGAVPTLLLGKAARASAGTALLTFSVAVAFALDGQSLSCLWYPHFEILIPLGVCICLSGLATGRERLAWIGIAITLATREDGGLHTTLFLAAAFASDVLGAPFKVHRKRILRMALVAFVGAIVSVAIQKEGFVGANLFREEYLGEPPLAHLTLAAIPARFATFSESARFILFPFVATVLLALWRRDPRYLLGWIAGLPWFFLNLFAAQPNKSAFTIYTGFPFVASIFWVAPYSMIAPHRARAHQTLVALGVVSLASTLGLQMTFRWTAGHLVRYSLPPETDHRAMIEFARTLRADPNADGRLWLDAGMVSWTIESAPVGSWMPYWAPGRYSNEGHDGVAFFRPSFVEWRFIEAVAHSPFDHCGRLKGNVVYLCTTPERPLPAVFVPASPLLDVNGLADDVRRSADGHVAFDATPDSRVKMWGPFAKLTPGAYRATWNVLIHDCAPSGPAPRVDVHSYPVDDRASADVVTSGPIDVPFEVVAADADRAFELRAWTGRCSFEITDLRLKAVSPP